MQYLHMENLTKSYISPDLVNIDNDKNLLLVAFAFTHPAGIDKLRRQWLKQRQGLPAIGRSSRQTQSIKLYEVGGAVTLLDLNIERKRAPKILADLDIANPMGIYYHSPTAQLLVGSAHSIKTVKHGLISKDLNHNLFNQVHTITGSSNGNVYSACAATDSIVEFNPSNSEHELWSWLATDHGLNFNKKGVKKMIEKQKNYQKINNGTRDHVTHLNCVETDSDGQVLATLFHQGEVIKISKNDGTYRTVLEGLTNPHGIHKISNGYIVSDTRRNRVLILDSNFKLIKEITGDFDWIQDSIEFGDYYIIGNDNKGRLEIINKEFRPISQYSWGKHLRKMSAMIKISAENAKNIFLT